MDKGGQPSAQNQAALIEPLERRLCFNAYSWILAVKAGNYPTTQTSVLTQPGGYDPKIGLLPFTQK